MMEPVRFSLVVLAVTTIVFLNLGGGEFMNGFLGKVVDDANRNSGEANRLIEIFEKYCNLFLIFLLPITAFFTWDMFEDSEYNGAENLVISAYIFSFQSLILVVLALLFSIILKDESDIGLVIQLVLTFSLSTFFQIYVYFKIFKQSLFKTIFRGFVIIFLSFFLYLIFFFLLLFIGGIR